MSRKPQADQPFDRLRAADPAAHAEPDSGALRAAVTSALGDQNAAEGAPQIPLSDGAHDELSARRRRRRSWQVAAAVAGALVVGGGGYGLGHVTAPGDVTADGPSMGLPLERPGMPANPLLGGPGGAQGGAPATAAISEGGAGPQDTAYRGEGYNDAFNARSTFTASGLGDKGTTVPMLGYDAPAAFTEKTAAALGKALNVSGKATLTDGGWVVGKPDSGAATVVLTTDGRASFYYNNPENDTWACPTKVEPGVVDSACAERKLGKAIQGDKAIASVKDLFITLGIDPAEFTFAASDPKEMGTSDYSYVSAQKMVEGAATQDFWSAGFSGAGLASLSGTMATLVNLGDVSVISPSEAVARLNDTRFDGNQQWNAFADVARAGDERVQSPATSDVPVAPIAGEPLPWPVQDVTITKADLGVAEQTLPNGAVVLAPTYTLTDADGATWTVLALAENHLNFAG